MEEKTKAAALRYVDGDEAPRVLAAGQGPLAAEILKLANLAGVPVFQDPHLLAALLQLEVGEVIPPALYRPVAEILAFIYRADAERWQAGRAKAITPKPD